ncbi:MAG: hypothetical protein IKD29_02460 [Lentisphaeria bacterium]|nr:hypothetical protein [Lentisphaeria bacterium]
MPSIKLETSAVLTKEQEAALALEITDLSAVLLNKPVEVIQVRIESNVTISFGGKVSQNSAFLSIAMIGNISPDVRPTLPEKFASMLSKYGIDKKQLFLNYTETPFEAWGWCE